MKKSIYLILAFVLSMVLLCLPVNAVANYNTYVPYYGYFTCYSDSGKNYARINMKWDSSMMGEFDNDNDTYEQDLIFYIINFSLLCFVKA